VAGAERSEAPGRQRPMMSSIRVGAMMRWRSEGSRCRRRRHHEAAMIREDISITSTGRGPRDAEADISTTSRPRHRPSRRRCSASPSDGPARSRIENDGQCHVAPLASGSVRAPSHRGHCSNFGLMRFSNENTRHCPASAACARRRRSGAATCRLVPSARSRALLVAERGLEHGDDASEFRISRVRSALAVMPSMQLTRRLSTRAASSRST